MSESCAFQDRRKVSAKRIGNFHQIEKRDIRFPAFDPPHVRAFNTGDVGQVLLGYPTINPRLSHGLTKWAEQMILTSISGGT